MKTAEVAQNTVHDKAPIKRIVKEQNDYAEVLFYTVCSVYRNFGLPEESFIMADPPRGLHEKRTGVRYQDPVLWSWLESFCLPYVVPIRT